MTTLLGLDLAGRPVLVVGGGPVAARPATALAADGALVTVVSPVLCEDLIDAYAAGRVAWACREVEEGDVDGVWLVHAATGDPQVDAQVCRWATERRTWSVNVGAAASGTTRTPECEPLDLRPRRRTAGTGRVVLVGGGPGAPDLLTIRGRRALFEADVVVTDRLGPTALLGELPSSVEVVDVGKTPGRHAVTQDEINRIIVEHAVRGRTVVRLKGGDPFLFGRGGEEVLACRSRGIPVEVVPGVSSALSAPAAAGIPLTHRGVAAGAHLTHGHGTLAAEAVACVVDRTATLIVLMGVGLLARHVGHLLAAGAHPATPVAIVEEATLPTQRTTHAPLSDIVEAATVAGVQAPAVIVVGDVAQPSLLEVP